MVACLALGTTLALSSGGCSGETVVAVDESACGAGLLDGLVGYWRLADSVDSPFAHDWTKQNDGTLSGLDPSMAWVTGGPEGGALSVEGTGFVNVPRSTSIDSVTDQVTVAAWMFLNGTITDYATAISRQIGTGYGQTYHLSVKAEMVARLFITTPLSGQVVITTAATVPSQTWVHLAGTYDGAEARLYIDGALLASGAVDGPFAAETNPVIVAGNQNGTDHATSELVPGRLAGVMLYKRALSDDEIARLHTCGSLASPGKDH